MALKNYDNETPNLYVAEKAKDYVEKIAKSNKLVVYVHDEPESDFNLPLSNRDWNLIMDSVKNPKYDEKIANLLNTPLLFEVD